MHRVVIFSDAYAGLPAFLVHNTVKVLNSRNDVDLVAVCLPKNPDHLGNLLTYGLRKFADLWRRVTGAQKQGQAQIVRPVSLRKLSRQMGFDILVPPQSDINHPSFIALLETRYKPTTALSLYCLKKFSPALLQVFDNAVNYHNGLLPRYRGMKATAWSIYNGDKESGFAFHRMAPEIDEGPLLVQRAVPVGDNEPVEVIELRKAELALQQLDGLVDRLNAGDPGVPQQGDASYYSGRDRHAIMRITDPGKVSSTELLRRLRAFAALNICVQGQWYRVTGLRKPAVDGIDGILRTGEKPAETVKMPHLSTGGESQQPEVDCLLAALPALTFFCADGRSLTVSRVEYLPPGIFRFRQHVVKPVRRLRRILSRKPE